MRAAANIHFGLFALLLGGGLTACNASFDDLRPPSTDSGGLDIAMPSEQGVDLGVQPDGRATDGGRDDGTRPDAVIDSRPPPDAAQAGPISKGAFSGLSGYQVSGEATVERQPDGSFKLLFSSTFSASSGPALVVVMSDRATLGTIQTAQGDVRVAELKSNSGAQSYDLSAAAAARRTVWIFCEPFGVDFGKAELKVLP